MANLLDKTALPSALQSGDKFYVVRGDTTDYVGDYDDLITPQTKTGTTIVFTENATYNETTYLTSGNLTLSLTGAVAGTNVIVYCDSYIPAISGETFYYGSGYPNNSSLNILSFFYDGSQIVLNTINVEYLDAPIITLTPSYTIMDVSWGAVFGATNYVVQRDTDSGFSSPTEIYSGSGTSYSDTGLTNGVTYYYRVMCSGNGYLDSDWYSDSAVPSETTLLADWDASVDGGITTSGGSVTSWVDSENGYELTESTNTPTHSTVDDEVIFDGSDRLNDYIAAFEFQQNDDFSVFIKGLRFTGGGTIIENKTAGANPGWRINFDSGGTNLYFNIRDASTQNYAQFTPGAAYNDNTPRDFIFVNEGGVMKIYDATNTNIGTNGTTSIGTVNYTSAQFYVGADSVNAAYLTGAIQQIKVYSGVLSSLERDTLLGL